MPPSTLKRLATEDGSVSPPATKRKLPPTTTSQYQSVVVISVINNYHRTSRSQLLHSYLAKRARKVFMENSAKLAVGLQVRQAGQCSEPETQENCRIRLCESE